MQHIGTETTITAGGKTYRLSRFERRHIRKFLDWAKTVLPDPIEALRGKLDGFTKEQQDMMLMDAVRTSRNALAFDSPEVQSLFRTPEGVSKVIAYLFDTHQPGMTEQQADEIYETARHEHGDEYLSRKIAEAMGVPPEVPSDPKAQSQPNVS